MRLQTQPAEHLAPSGRLSYNPLAFKEIDESFGTDALAISIDDIHIATEDKTSFLAEILGLAGGCHHALLGIGNPNIANGRHNPSAIIGLLAIRLNAYHAIVANNDRIAWAGGRSAMGRSAQRRRWQLGVSWRSCPAGHRHHGVREKDRKQRCRNDAHAGEVERAKQEPGHDKGGRLNLPEPFLAGLKPRQG
jgi:hypothetical protein